MSNTKENEGNYGASPMSQHNNFLFERIITLTHNPSIDIDLSSK